MRIQRDHGDVNEGVVMKTSEDGMVPDKSLDSKANDQPKPHHNGSRRVEIEEMQVHELEKKCMNGMEHNVSAAGEEITELRSILPLPTINNDLNLLNYH